MRLHHKIRKWLLMNEDRNSIEALLVKTRIEVSGLKNYISSLEKTIQTQTLLLARIVANMDPLFRRSEMDPKRQAQSDRLGNEVIKRLLAEQEARDRQNLPEEEFNAEMKRREELGRFPSGSQGLYGKDEK